MNWMQQGNRLALSQAADLRSRVRFFRSPCNNPRRLQDEQHFINIRRGPSDLTLGLLLLGGKIQAERGRRMATGVVKWFNDNKGYGFITGDGVEKDIFVHYSAIKQAGFKTLLQGQQVQFELDQNSRGARAANVCVVEA